MRIRQATVNDAETLLAYLAAFWADGCDTLPFLRTPPTLEQEKEWLAGQSGEHGIILVAEEDGIIIGVSDAAIPRAEEYRHTCTLGLSVLPAHRNKGVGRQLMEHLLRWAEGRGLWRVELNVFSNNLPAMALYRRLGFVEDGRRVNAVRLRNGGLCDLVHMFTYTDVARRALQRAP